MSWGRVQQVISDVYYKTTAMSYNARLTLILGRRRKIRCKFHSSDASTCIQCAARGSRCLDQRDVSPVNHGAISDESTSFRERAIALESMVKHHAQVSRDPSLGLQALDLTDEPVEADTRVPFISLLNNVVVSWSAMLA
jgi:hypothetical protein